MNKVILIIAVFIAGLAGSLAATTVSSAHQPNRVCKSGSPDINGDGVVNIKDLSLLLAQYGKTIK